MPSHSAKTIIDLLSPSYCIVEVKEDLGPWSYVKLTPNERIIGHGCYLIITVCLTISIRNPPQAFMEEARQGYETSQTRLQSLQDAAVHGTGYRV